MNKLGCIAICFVSTALGQDAWTTRMSVANRLQAEGSYADARKLYEQAVSESTYSKERYAQATNNFAAHLYETGDYKQAEPMYRKAIAEWRALNQNGRLGVTVSNLATLYRKTGRFSEAIDTFNEAQTLISAAHGTESPELISCLVNWSEAYRASGRLTEAEATAAKALALSEQTFAATDGRLSHTLHAYAAALQSIGRVSETLGLHERALSIREAAYGPEHPFVAATLTAMVSAYLETGRHAEAEPLANRALSIWDAKLGSEHLNTAVAMNNLAQVHRMQDRPSEAEPLYRRSIEILQKHKSPEAAKPLTNLADFYTSRGRYFAALALYKQAEEITRAAFGDGGHETEAAKRKVVKAYEAMGRNTEAERVRRRLDEATIAGAASR